MTGNNRKIVALVLLLGAIAVAYSSSINGEFQFDDTYWIEENLQIKDITRLDSLGPWVGGRPVTHLTIAINYSLSRLEPFGYHATNLLIHLGVVLLVYLFTRKTFQLAHHPDPDSLALIVVGIFGLHPLHSQAVSYIIQRGESLASLWYLLALTLLVRSCEWGFRCKGVALYVLGIAAFVLGLGTKEIVVTLPLTLALYGYYFLAPTLAFASPAGKNGKYRTLLMRAAFWVPLFTVGGVYAILRIKSFFGPDQAVGFNISGISPTTYLLTQFEVVVTYLRLILLPVGLNFDYDYPLSSGFFTPPTFLSFGVIVGILFLSFFLWLAARKNRGRQPQASAQLVISFALLWFLLILSPTSTFIPIVDVIFEHRPYLASWGIITSLVATGALLYHRLRNTQGLRVTMVTRAVVVALMAALAIGLYERNKVWRSRKELWADVVEKSPGKARAHMNLGHALEMQGDFSGAIGEYKVALRLADDKSIRKIDLLRNLGAALLRLGRLQGAIDVFMEAKRLAPWNPDILNNLAIAFLDAGEYQEAFRHAGLAITARPTHGGAHNTLGEVYLKRKEYAKALESFLQAIKLNPDIPLRYFNAALTYEKLGKVNKACAYWAMFLELEKDHGERNRVRKHMTESGCV
jgi:Flp pilus assembly protein TadD